MYLLGIHNGVHDASACLFRDYEWLAAISQERLTRKKNDGVAPAEELPLAAVDECLAIAGISRADIDVVCSTRSQWEMQSFALSGRMWARQQYGRFTGRQRLYQMTYMMRKQATKRALDVFDMPSFRRRHGFARPRCTSAITMPPTAFRPISFPISRRADLQRRRVWRRCRLQRAHRQRRTDRSHLRRR